MVGLPSELQTHLASGVTTLARAWAITRKDGATFGFTDHDRTLDFEGISFKADTGLTASALAQTTGLSADNSEAVGALSDASVTEADIDAGRFDGAEVTSWLVNWADTAQRWLQFRGTIGELRRAGGAFTAELRGLSDMLNQPIGRVYQKPCAAVLGDAECGVNLATNGFAFTSSIVSAQGTFIKVNGSLEAFASDWFVRGRLDVLDGEGAGLWGSIKRQDNAARVIELWEPLRADLSSGDQVKLSVGCDKRFETCRVKFANVRNFRGFPDLPGEDWMTAVPRTGKPNTGGSRR